MLDGRVEIIKTVRATPVVLRALVHGVDDAGLRRRLAAGEWAIIEVVGHLADTEERALGRVRRMLAEDDPQLEDNLTPIGRAFYTASALLCVPHSLSEEIGLALGAQAGEQRLREVATAAGFRRFRRAAQTPFNLIYEARP
jgi:hypothetical protein